MARTPAVQFRRSPHIVSFWRAGDLIFHNYATGSRVRGNPIVCDLLHQFDRWRPMAAVTAGRSAAEARLLGRLTGELARRSLLERSDCPASPAERAMSNWNGWNPEAGFFHAATKNVSYNADVAAGERRLRVKATTSPMPPAVKRYRRAPTIGLPDPHLDSDLSRALIARRTWRHFSRRPLDIGSLATLLGLTWGVREWRTVRGQGRIVLKTSPSGGARHPIEAYVLALRVKDVAPGLYHYAADRHRLERLADSASPRTAVRYCAGQTWYKHAAALVIMTAVFAREQWRYASPRAYRAVLLDAGHLCQTFCLVATALGLAPFCTMALADSLIERDLGIDGVTESAIYIAGVGMRPAGGWNEQLQRAALDL